MKDSLQCPVDHVLINENKARIIAFCVLLTGIAYILTGYLFLLAFLLFDFFVRVANLPAASLLGFLADIVIRKFKVSNKPVDRAPKRFAAGTGLVFILLIICSLLLQWPTVALVLSLVLCLFASLEAFFAFCAGCYVYSFLHFKSLVRSPK